MLQNFNPKKNLEYNLEVGEYLQLKEKIMLRDQVFQIAYAGMLSKDVFSITHCFDISEANMFYPISKKEINFYGQRFEVLSVDAEKIKLKYLGVK